MRYECAPVPSYDPSAIQKNNENRSRNAKQKRTRRHSSLQHDSFVLASIVGQRALGVHTKLLARLVGEVIRESSVACKLEGQAPAERSNADRRFAVELVRGSRLAVRAVFQSPILDSND
jgi:hypothetical protein